jgi:uncharacterized protein
MPQTMLPDVNVLVAAHRADHPQHKSAAQWLKSALKDAQDGQQLVLPIQVISAFLRLVTNAKIFLQPSSPEKAIDFIDWLLEDPQVRLLEQSSEWQSFRTLVIEKQLSANAIPDAHLASLAISMSEPFVTFDKGFRQLLPRSLLTLLPVV